MQLKAGTWINRFAFTDHTGLCVAEALQLLVLRADCDHVFGATPHYGCDVLPVLFHLPEDKLGSGVWQSSSPDSQQRLLCHLNMRQQALIIAENDNLSRWQCNSSPIYSMLPHTLFVHPIICDLKKNLHHLSREPDKNQWSFVFLFVRSVIMLTANSAPANQR